MYASIFPMFLIVILGYVIRRFWISNDSFWSSLSSLSINLLFPVAIFNYLFRADLKSYSSLTLVLILVLITLVLLSFLFFIQFRIFYPINKLTACFQGLIRYNSYVFFGIGSFIFNDLGMQLVAIISFYMIIFVSILTSLFYAFHSKEKLNVVFKNFVKNILFDPVSISLFLSAFFNFYNICLTDAIQKSLHLIGNSALLVGNLTVGGSLILQIKDFRCVLFISFMKLILSPFIAFILLNLFDVQGVIKDVIILYASLPIGNSAVPIIRQFNGDYELMSSITTTTILISLLTIPIVLRLFL